MEAVATLFINDLEMVTIQRWCGVISEYLPQLFYGDRHSGVLQDIQQHP